MRMLSPLLQTASLLSESFIYQKSAERRGHQSEILESEEPKLDLEKEFNNRFSTFRQTIDDQVKKRIAITVTRTSGKEKASELHDV